MDRGGRKWPAMGERGFKVLATGESNGAPCRTRTCGLLVRSWLNEQAPSRGGARPGRGAGTSVGRCRWRSMRSIADASSISAISRKRPPSLDPARDGPEHGRGSTRLTATLRCSKGRRATAGTGQDVKTKRPAHEVRPAPCLLPGRSPLTTAGRIGRRLGGAGLAIGLVLAAAAAHLLATSVYGVRAADPVAFGAGTAVVAVVAIAASWLPARRAQRMDPVVALRQQ